MAQIDLDTLGMDELKQLRKDIDKAIANFEVRRKQEALAAIDATAREYGFSVAELLEAGGKKSRKSPVHPPKYRHPDNPELTWSGRGRQPAWVKEVLEAGQSLDDYLIA